MPAKRSTLTTRVEAKLKREVQDIAAKEQRTNSQMTAILIAEALQARQSKEAQAA